MSEPVLFLMVQNGSFIILSEDEWKTSKNFRALQMQKSNS